MKLNYKYTFSYATITLIVLSIGITIVYQSVRHNIIRSLSSQLENLNEMQAAAIRNKNPQIGLPSGTNVSLEKISIADTAKFPRATIIITGWSKEVQAQAPMLLASKILIYKDTAYYISSKALLTLPDNSYKNGIILVFAWVLVFLISLVVVASEVTSWYILKPFNDILYAIQEFNIDQENTIDVQDTFTNEFKTLNTFLVKMTNKAKSDFRALKEFSENASHELQTPIATIRAKVETLIETDLNESQLATLSKIEEELERVSRINQALILLVRLEQYDPDTAKVTQLGKLLQRKANRFNDWAEIREVSIKTRIESSFDIYMEPDLAEIAFANLLNNAVRHNKPGGEIVVEAIKGHVLIMNTGDSSGIAPEDVFNRFKKGKNSSKSIGIGLAIVKRICDLYKYPISYSYKDGWHSIKISFGEKTIYRPDF